MENKKNVHAAGLTIGILSIPCGLLIAITGWVLGIIGIVINSKNKNTANTTAGLVCSIIGLVLSVINSIFGIILSLNSLLSSL